MSDLRIALVAEGPTDSIVIEAALKAILSKPFVLTLLQPEETRPTIGRGWGGVLRWCFEFAKRGLPKIEDDPMLPGFDLFVIHVDADVAECAYADLSAEIAVAAGERGYPPLPCVVPCPPPTNSVDQMRNCLQKWLSVVAPGPKTVFCVPSKSIDAWLASAVLDSGHALLPGIECNLNLAAQLEALPVRLRVKKTTLQYRTRSAKVTASWNSVRQRCSQAERFSNDVLSVPL